LRFNISGVGCSILNSSIAIAEPISNAAGRKMCHCLKSKPMSINVNILILDEIVNRNEHDTVNKRYQSNVNVKNCASKDSISASLTAKACSGKLFYILRKFAKDNCSGYGLNIDNIDSKTRVHHVIEHQKLSNDDAKIRRNRRYIFLLL